MRIANIVCTYPPYKGGIGTAAFDFSRLMPERGFEVETFVPDRGDTPEEERSGVHRIKPFLSMGNGAFIPSLYGRLRNFDILYLHYPFFGGAEIVWLFKMMNPDKKLFIRYHMDVEGLSLPAKILSIPSKLIEKSLLAKTDKIITASLDYIKNGDLKGFYSKDPGKFIEIPYSVDTERFTPGKAESDDPERKQILFVGGLDRAHYFKGVDKLTEAVSLLEKEGYKNWELFIAGSGDMAEEYKNKADKNGIGDKVKFLGKVPDEDLPRLYAESDITVLPSTAKGEAFGIVLVESMACGTPVVASALPGVRSVFTNGKEGLVSRPGDVADLKDKLISLLTDNRRLHAMSKAAVKTVKDKYSRRIVGDKLASVLKSS